MFGVFFVNQNKLTRLLTDYGFQGYGRPTGIVDFSLLACDVI